MQHFLVYAYIQISHRQEYEGRHTPTNHRRTASDRGVAAVRAFQSVVAPVRAPPKTALAVTIYEIGLSVVEKLERKVKRYNRKWLGLLPALSSVALYSRSTILRLQLRSIVAEYKLSKIRSLKWMLNNSAKSSPYTDLEGNSERRMRSTNQ